MTHRWKYILPAILLAVLAVSLGAMFWLLGTRDGAHWLMNIVSRQTPYTISARRVEGRIWNDLRLEGVQLRWPEGGAQIGSVRLRWKPLFLLMGKVAVGDLVLKDVRVRDDRPESTAPPELSWPKVSGIPAWLNMRIRKLQVDGLEYRRLGEAPVAVTGISSSRIMWQGSLLTVRTLALTTPSLHLDGAIMAGFRRPSLLLKLTATPAHPVAGVDKLTCDARLLPAHSPEQVAGPVKFTGLSGRKQLLGLTGEIGVTRNSINMRQLRLLQTGRRGVVNGGGTLEFTTGKPLLRLQVGFADLDLSPELRTATTLSGVLGVEGNTDGYRGSFSISNRGAGWRAGRLSGSFQGDDKGVRLSHLDGLLLDGTVTGTAQVDWREGIFLSGALQGRNLNPAKVTPQWSGAVNMDLSGSARWSKTTPLQAEVSGRLLESSLRGKSLTGEVDAGLLRDNLLIKRLDLRGKGFDIHAEGESQKRLAFRAKVSDLSGLIPDTGGRLDAEGWVRWHAGRLSGSVTGEGRNISVAGLRLTTADLAARLSEKPGYPLEVDAKVRGAAYRQVRLGSANLRATGGVERHTIDAALFATGFEVRTKLTGGYKARAWRGEIMRLSGHDGVGPWKLRAPTDLHVAADSISLAHLAIDGAQGENLEADAQVTFQPLHGFIRTEWRSLNLARISRWLGDVQLAGLSSGAIQIRWPGGDRLLVNGRADASGTAVVDGRRMTVRQAFVQMDWSDRGMLTLFELRLAEGGTLRGRFSSPQPARMAIPSRGDMEADWHGLDIAMLNSWLPVGLDLEGRLAGRVRGTLSPGIRLDIRGNAAVSSGAVRWQEKGDQFTATLHRADLSWIWQGGKGTAGPGKGALQTRRMVLDGRIDASVTAVLDGHRITAEQTSLRLDWNERGMNNTLDARLADGGIFKGSFSSPLPFQMAVPRQGVIEADWQGIDIALLHPWLPSGLDMEGRLSGGVKGALLPDKRLDLKGNVAVSRGAVRWSREESQLSAKLDTAEISWAWSGSMLTGDISVALAEYGQARGSFQLPLAAHLPVVINRQGPVTLSVGGRAREMGLLTSVFPGLIQESHGKIDFALQADGKWQEPRFKGNLRLAEAGAYLPAAGISVKDVRMNAYLEQDKLRIDSFQVNSGPGRMEGTAVVQLKAWHVAGYQGNIKGERFQIVYLPDLQVSVSPNLSFTGSPEKLAVRGDIHIPELLVLGQTARTPVQPSKDVVIEGEAKPAEKEFPLPVDIQVDVILGDRVLVKAQGIDAQLKGSLKLFLSKIDEIRSAGEIRVVKGSYKTYGVNLEISRGRIFYAGGPIDQPNLDIRALRKVEDVRAGVIISGTPNALAVKLFSEPSMPDADILSYIVLGQPLAYGKEQTGLMIQAARVLLSSSQSMDFQEQLKQRLGIDIMTVTSGVGGIPGYKPIPVTPPGAVPAKAAEGTLPETMVTVGKYLTPKLYISYGRSLFTGSNLLRLRYNLSRRWDIETQTGTASGGDIYFKINLK